MKRHHERERGPSPVLIEPRRPTAIREPVDTTAMALGNQALLRLVAPTAPPIQALGGFRGRGRDDERFEHEAHRAADRLAGGAPLRGDELTSTAGARTGLEGVHPALEADLDQSRASGRPLPHRVRRSLSHDLGADLGEVRVHTDDRAHALNQRLGARAFARGRDVYFRRGGFDPDSRGGREVLHHELSHVVQQCGRRPDGALGRASRPTIQRFIMQIGADDSYTQTMSDDLKKSHGDESFLKFNAAWDSTWSGGTHGEYNPTKVKYHKVGGFSYSTSRKLKGVPNSEPLRIVAHGNIYGSVGGYTADRMFALLQRLGLPTTHTGGIDVHACLPASSYSDKGSDVVKQPHIVQLQDLLNGNGWNEVVRGYKHTITPAKGGDVEVDARGYGLYAEVVKPLFNASLPGQKPRYVLSDDQIETIRDHLGTDTDAFLKSYVKDHVITSPYAAFMSLRGWLEKQGYYHSQARLRRAESVRLP